MGLELCYWKSKSQGIDECVVWIRIAPYVIYLKPKYCFDQVEYSVSDGAFLGVYLVWLLSCHVCDSECLVTDVCTFPVGTSCPLICLSSLACSNSPTLREPGYCPASGGVTSWISHTLLCIPFLNLENRIAIFFLWLVKNHQHKTQ